MVVVPAVNAVANPVVAPMLDTAGVLDDQVTWFVTFNVEDGWLPWATVPKAEN